jgi:hypothetical protein
MDMSAIQAVEKKIADAKIELAGAVKSTFVKGTKVLVKGPRGDQETSVIRVEGEDVFLTTAKSEMKRHYSVVRLA